MEILYIDCSIIIIYVLRLEEQGVTLNDDLITGKLKKTVTLALMPNPVMQFYD